MRFREELYAPDDALLPIGGYYTTNSRVSLISPCEWRVGLTLMATRGGLIDVGITHANVIMFAFPALPVQVTSTVCIGCKNL